MDHQEEALKVYIGLLRSSSHLEQVAKQDVRCYGLNLTEFSVLELLYHKGTHTTQAIKEKILIASSSTTYVIDQLVKKGCVRRETSQTDQRITYVSPAFCCKYCSLRCFTRFFFFCIDVDNKD